MSALSVKALQKRGLDVPGALATLLCWPQQGLPAVLPLLASCGAHAVATQREKQRLCQPGDVARAPGGVQTPFLQRFDTQCRHPLSPRMQVLKSGRPRRHSSLSLPKFEIAESVDLGDPLPPEDTPRRSGGWG